MLRAGPPAMEREARYRGAARPVGSVAEHDQAVALDARLDQLAET
jgi:hypothetical protein